jgi:hypothetical protein
MNRASMNTRKQGCPRWKITGAGTKFTDVRAVEVVDLQIV